MQNKLTSMLLLSCLTVSTPAFAESTADNLSKIEAETLLLKAREKQLEVQSQIVTKQNEIATKRATAEYLEHITSMAMTGDPVIHGTERIGKSVYATLQLSNGSFIDVTVGNMLPNGMRVLSIQPNEVIVQTRKKQRVRLGAGYYPPATYGVGMSNGAAGMPPLPPLLPTGGIIR